MQLMEKRYIELNSSGDSGILSQIHYVPAGLALFNVITLTAREWTFCKDP